MVKRKSDPSLTKIIIALLAVGAIGVGVLRFSDWFNRNYIGAEVEASAMDNITKARSLAEQGNVIEARELLRPILMRVDSDLISPKALMLQAEIERESGNRDRALASLRIVIEDYPSSSDQPIAAVSYARLLEEKEDYDGAAEMYRKVRDSAPPPLRVPALVGLGRYEERKNNLLDARDWYSEAAREAKWGTESWKEATNRLGDLNVRLIFSNEPTPESRVYRVQPGDTLIGIGMKLNTTQGLLMGANNMKDPHRLRLGQNLKYTPKDFHVIIERSTRSLYLMDKNGLFKSYSVGLGKPGQSTPVGKYRIGNKEKNPTWFKPGEGPIAPGDPRNELGTRWMPMVPAEEALPRDLGIHGTIDPDSIGRLSSMGCPRMYPEEVEELYDLIVRSTPVSVMDAYDPT